MKTLYLIRWFYKHEEGDSLIALVEDKDYADDFVKRQNLRIAEAKLIEISIPHPITGKSVLDFMKQDWQEKKERELRKWQPSKKNKGIKPEIPPMPSDLDFASEAADFAYDVISMELKTTLPEPNDPNYP